MVVEKLRQRLDGEIDLSMSVGVGRFDAVKCQTVQQLLEEADAEIYSSKRRRSTPELL
jgi:predicted signal transduction protein with EAL and GGDEF domain